MRRGRFLAALVLALLIAPGHWWRSSPVASSGNGVQFEALKAQTPVDWPKGLTIEQAWHLDPANNDFAGFSALVLDEEGFTAFSDFGSLVRFPRPNGQALQLPLTPLPRTAEIAHTPDVEAAIFDPESGSTWLAYEYHNKIRRIDRDGRSLFGGEDYLASLGLNSGIEAMARLDEDRFLLLAEHGGRGFLVRGDPAKGGKAEKFAFARAENFRPTDMAVLPDGRVLVLLRALEYALPPFTSMLAIGDPDAIRSDKTWQLDPLAVIDSRGLRENYEGIAVEPAANGALTIWLISDSNRAALQRTLLLKLHWQPETQTAREEDPASR